MSSEVSCRVLVKKGKIQRVACSCMNVKQYTCIMKLFVHAETSLERSTRVGWTEACYAREEFGCHRLVTSLTIYIISIYHTSGRIDEDYVQSALSIRLLKENHSKYHKMLGCTRSASACWLLVFTAPVLKPSFLCFRRTIFQ